MEKDEEGERIREPPEVVAGLRCCEVAQDRRSGGVTIVIVSAAS